jgi:hypothetical protein
MIGPPFRIWNHQNNNKFWEKINRLLFLIRHGPCGKRRVQKFFYCCVCIRYRGNVSTEPLPSNDRGLLLSRCLATIRGYTDTHTDTKVISLAYYIFQIKESRLKSRGCNNSIATSVLFNFPIIYVISSLLRHSYSPIRMWRHPGWSHPCSLDRHCDTMSAVANELVSVVPLSVYLVCLISLYLFIKIHILLIKRSCDAAFPVEIFYFEDFNAFTFWRFSKEEQP